jgi:hypothetical protein
MKFRINKISKFRIIKFLQKKLQKKQKYVIINYIKFTWSTLMKKLNKILIFTIFLGCLGYSISLADNSDCGIFVGTWFNQEWHTDNWFKIVNDQRETNNTTHLSGFLTIEQQKEILTKDDLNTALLNLKKYCCENELWWLSQDAETCKKDKIYFNDNALDSAYLINHLFDVIMRRLSWLNWDNDIYKKTNLTTDTKWSERRERINNQAESTKWSTPQTISTQYNKFRSQTEKYDIRTLINHKFSEGGTTFLNFVRWDWEDLESKKVMKAMQEYKERTLYDRYRNACDLTEYFYILLGWGRSDNENRIGEKMFSNNCYEFINKQISWENEYVQLITKKSSNLFLSNYIQWYMSYMFERQMKLQKLWKESTDRFLDVVRGVSCLQSKCVQ